MELRLLIIAQDVRAAEELRRVLRHASRCRLVGTLGYGQLHAMPAGDAAPDLIVLDAGRDEHRAIASVRTLRAAAPASRIVLLTAEVDDGRLDAAMGLDAVILRTLDPTTLGTLIEQVAAGTIFHPAARGYEAAAEPPALTARELEILRLVAGGASNALIATRLWVTEQTVKFHLSNVYRKLGVANRTQASHYAHVNGLVGTARRGAATAVPEAA